MARGKSRGGSKSIGRISKDPVVKPGGKRPTAKGSMGQSVKGGFGRNKQGSRTGLSAHAQKGLF
jgi:hypothetical protein